jgi:hypothetical protein
MAKAVLESFGIRPRRDEVGFLTKALASLAEGRRHALALII